MTIIKLTRLRVDAEDISIKCFSPKVGLPRWGGVFLHGAGSSNKERGDALCTEMTRRGMLTVAFDFSGYGESTQRSPGSIQKRVAEATAVLERLILPSGLPLAVLAFSMSGQVAIELLRTLGNDIRCLALFNPAIYDRLAFSVPFGAEFSAVIRRPQSWRNAAIASAFDGYRGKTLLVKSEHDDVIPPEVLDLIAQAAPADSVSNLIIESAPHQMGAFLNANPSVAARVADVIAGLLASQEHECKSI